MTYNDIASSSSQLLHCNGFVIRICEGAEVGAFVVCWKSREVRGKLIVIGTLVAMPNTQF